MCSQEFCNTYVELNDPFERTRFNEMKRRREMFTHASVLFSFIARLWRVTPIFCLLCGVDIKGVLLLVMKPL